MTDRPTESADRPSRWGRRGFLSRAGAAIGGAIALAGCGGREEDPQPLPPTTPPDLSWTPNEESPPEPFDAIVDLAQRGLDGGHEATAGALADAVTDAARDGVLLRIPPGSYPVPNAIAISGYERFGIASEGATLVAPPDNDSGLLTLIGGAADDGTLGALRIDGLAFDFTAAGAGGRALDARCPNGLLVRNVAVAGRFDRGRGAVRVDVTDPDGSGLVEGLSLPDGSAGDTTATGCYVGNRSVGDVTFRDCRIEGFADNGLYADPPGGSITVEGGYYANNAISSVRVRGGSVVRGVHVRCDRAPDGFDNMRGIRLSDYEPQPDSEPALVEDCLVEMATVTGSDGGVTLSSQLAAATIRDTEIVVDADGVHAIWVKPPDESLREEANPRFEGSGITVTGDARSGTAIQIDERDGTVIDGVTVRQPGADRNGVGLSRSRGNVLRHATLDVGGRAIVLSDATLERHDVRTVDGTGDNVKGPRTRSITKPYSR